MTIATATVVDIRQAVALITAMRVMLTSIGAPVLLTASLVKVTESEMSSTVTGG
jgi:hypothetical protein